MTGDGSPRPPRKSIVLRRGLAPTDSTPLRFLFLGFAGRPFLSGERLRFPRGASRGRSWPAITSFFFFSTFLLSIYSGWKLFLPPFRRWGPTFGFCLPRSPLLPLTNPGLCSPPKCIPVPPRPAFTPWPFAVIRFRRFPPCFLRARARLF